MELLMEFLIALVTLAIFTGSMTISSSIDKVADKLNELIELITEVEEDEEDS